jgi:hypothetical protein
MDENTARRLAAVGVALSAVAHAVAPRTLLDAAARGYAVVMRVEFDPKEGAVRRVRLLAVPSLLAAAYLWSTADST